MSMVAGLIVGAVAGLIGGLGQAIASDVEYKEKLAELGRKRDDLTESYNQAVAQTRAQAADAEENLRANIADTKLAQGVGIGTAAHNAVMQEQIAQQQMAELQISAREQQGAAVQGAAVSGIRQFGNAQVYRTGRAADRAMTSARMQRELSRFQTLESARANYYNADRQIASYNRQIDYNSNELQRTLDRYETSYRQQYNELTYDIDYMNDTSWTGGWTMHWMSNVFNVLSLGMSGASSGMSMYRQGQGYLWDKE